jgi:glutaconate CoA-transferase, subunit A
MTTLGGKSDRRTKKETDELTVKGGSHLSDNKVIPLSEAIRKFVEDGDTIALGGWVVTRCAVASVHELIRQGRKNLTVHQGLSGLDTDLLVGAGCVSRLVTAGGTLDAFGLLNRVNYVFSKGKLEVENNSALGMATRFLAGSLGLPFLPTRSMLGSSIMQDLVDNAKTAVEMKDPFTGETVLLLKALNPKTAIIHVQRADKDGNAQIDGPVWDSQAIAGAADKIMLTTEELVEKEEITKSPERTIIPAFKVESVSTVPFGAHPTSCYKYYDYDAPQLRLYSESSSDTDKFEKYVRENVLAHENFHSYLDAVCPPERREALKAKSGRGY